MKSTEFRKFKDGVTSIFGEGFSIAERQGSARKKNDKDFPRIWKVSKAENKWQRCQSFSEDGNTFSFINKTKHSDLNIGDKIFIFRGGIFLEQKPFEVEIPTGPFSFRTEIRFETKEINSGVDFEGLFEVTEKTDLEGNEEHFKMTRVE